MLVTNTTSKPITYINHLGAERILNPNQGYGLSSAEAEYVDEILKVPGVKVAKSVEAEPEPKAKSTGKKK